MWWQYEQRPSFLYSAPHISSRKLVYSTTGTSFTYLFGIRGDAVPYSFEFGSCQSVVFEIVESKKISREGTCQCAIEVKKENSYRADRIVDDATMSFPAFELRGTEVGPSEGMVPSSGSSTVGTSNDGFRIVRSALPFQLVTDLDMDKDVQWVYLTPFGRSHWFRNFRSAAWGCPGYGRVHTLAGGRSGCL